MAGKRYDKYYQPPSDDKKLLDKQALYPLSYRQAVAVINALDDLHCEAARPPEERLADYPIAEMEELHTSIAARLIPCLRILEAEHESKGD